MGLQQIIRGGAHDVCGMGSPLRRDLAVCNDKFSFLSSLVGINKQTTKSVVGE